MNASRVRAIFAWAAVAAVVVSLVAFPILDAHLRPNYRALDRADSVDLLALAVATDDVLAAQYSLPLAVREHAPGATLVVSTEDIEGTWPRVRLAGLAGVADVVVAPGSSDQWAAGALVDGNVVASSDGAPRVKGWQLALDPGGDNDTLVLIEDYEGKTLVISSALLPAFPGGEVAS